MKNTLIPTVSSLIVASFLLAPATCQVVSPKHFAQVEGSSYVYRPFGSNNASGWRYQQVHDDLMGMKTTIRELAFRRDAPRTNRYSAYEFTVSVVLSTASKTAATMTSTFADNHGTNKKLVTVNRTVKMPATRPDTVAAPWVYRIKLDTPYAFDGTNGGLCWETQTSLFRGIVSTVYMDGASSASANPALAQTYFGQGCVHSSQVNPSAMTTSSSTNYSQKVGSIRVNGSYLARNSLAIGTIGFSRTNLGAIPLPLVIPGSQNAYSGACSIYASLDLVFAAATTSTGSASVTVPIPVDVQYGGAKLFVQLFSVDDQTSASLGLITSNAAEMQFVPPYVVAPISRVYASNTLAATGSLNRNYGLVTAAF